MSLLGTIFCNEKVLVPFPFGGQPCSCTAGTNEVLLFFWPELMLPHRSANRHVVQ